MKTRYKGIIKAMKNKRSHLLFSVLVAIMAAFPSIARGEEIFAELSGMKMVESTYVSGKFSHNMKRWNSRNGYHSMDLSQGFSSLYTYQCYTEAAVSKAQSILKAYLKKNPDLELMMHSKEMSEDYQLYESFNKDGSVKELIIWSSAAPNLCEIVVVDWKNGLKRNSGSYQNQ